MNQHCLLNCLGLSNQLVEAAQAQNWEQVEMLHDQWRREIASCTQYLNEQAEQEPEQAARAIKQLHADVVAKIQFLEKIISQLQFEQQQELHKLNQAKAYLK